MTSRSIVLSTAALLLLTAATPVQIGFSPTAAFAQEVSAELREALTGDPARLEPRQLSEHIRVLRDAIQAGVLQGQARRAAREKMEAYREVLQQHRAQRQGAGQDDQQAGQQAEQPRQGDRAQGQRSERKAERRAEQDQRKAERQAEKAERQTEKAARQAAQQAQTQQQAQRAQQQAQQAQQAQSALSPEMIAALRDNRPGQALGRSELRDRIQMLRAALESGALSRDQRNQVQARIQADREVMQAGRAERQEETAEKPRQRETAAEKPRQRETAAEQPREQRSERTRAREIPKEEVDRRARAIISDSTPARDLDNQALRKRLQDNRSILATGKLSRNEERDLRQQLREDREELRSRVASRQRTEEKTQERTRERAERRPDSRTGPAVDTRDVSRIIEQRIASDRLTDRELEERVRVLSRALRGGNITVRQSEVARLLIEQDRNELRRRLHADRDHRRERRRQARSRNEVFIDFHVGFQPPPVIFAAEAMRRDIEIQLVAPPMQRMSRSYTVREIAANPDVREMMPGIEIDTLNFDFGSAEVRPEEIDKLDDIADVIERIVAERPDEVFLLEGHTDAVGSHAANDALSLRRAEAVREALLDYYEIYPENLQTVGLGKRYLKIWTEEAEEENRRVTVRRITPLLVGARG